MSETASLQRLFVAVPVPQEVFAFIQVAQALLPPVEGLRLAREDQFHITLAFIGEVDQEKAAAAAEVVRSVPTESGGEATLAGFLYFPSVNKARVVALGVDDPTGVFPTLFEQVMTGLEKRGVMRREKRPFKPHLTIARLRIPRLIRPRSEPGSARFALQSVCLYRSELRREGALYTVLEEKALEIRQEQVTS